MSYWSFRRSSTDIDNVVVCCCALPGRDATPTRRARELGTPTRRQPLQRSGSDFGPRPRDATPPRREALRPATPPRRREAPGPTLAPREATPTRREHSVRREPTPTRRERREPTPTRREPMQLTNLHCSYFALCVHGGYIDCFFFRTIGGWHLLDDAFWVCLCFSVLGNWGHWDVSPHLLEEILVWAGKQLPEMIPHLQGTEN